MEKAQPIATALLDLMKGELASTLEHRQHVVCVPAVGRLSRSLSRLDPPLELTPDALKQYAPVLDQANPMGPMYVPELVAKQVCYPRGTECCQGEICWSVHQGKQLGLQLWPPQLAQKGQ